MHHVTALLGRCQPAGLQAKADGPNKQLEKISPAARS
jgi:hypothetical protein